MIDGNTEEIETGMLEERKCEMIGRQEEEDARIKYDILPQTVVTFVNTFYT